MPKKSRYSSIEKRFAMFLAKLAPRLEDDVERAFRQWNNVVRDHLRTETGLRLTIGNETQAVPVRIEDGLPDAFAQAIESSDEGTWALLMHRGVLRETAKGMRFLRRDFKQVSTWLATEPTRPQYNEGRQLEARFLFEIPKEDHKPARYDEVRHVEALLYSVLRRLRSLEFIERVKAINRDVLGAYFFQNVPTVELYWMVIVFVAGLIGVSVEALTVVVIIHELAHAYSHLGRDIDGKRWITTDFEKAEPGIIEGLAQFYTASICSKLEHRFPSVQQAYKSLLALQSGPYRVHEEWLNGQDKDRAGEVLRMSMIRCRSTGITKLADFQFVRRQSRRGLNRLAAKLQGAYKPMGTPS